MVYPFLFTLGANICCSYNFSTQVKRPVDTRFENLWKQASESVSICAQRFMSTARMTVSTRLILLFMVIDALHRSTLALIQKSVNNFWGHRVEQKGAFLSWKASILCFRLWDHRTWVYDNRKKWKPPSVMAVFHMYMMTHSSSMRRQERTEALQYWKKLNWRTETMFISRPCNMFTRALASFQASFKLAESFFSDSRKLRNEQAQFMFSKTLEINELTREFVKKELSNLCLPWKGVRKSC